MRFCALVTCHDSGYPLRAGEKTPTQRGYRKDKNYNITEGELAHLISIGLFPESFEPELLSISEKRGRVHSLEGTEFWNNHIAEWEEAAKRRYLPFRDYTPEESKEFQKMVGLPEDGGQGMAPDKARAVLIQRERDARKGEPDAPVETREQELERENQELRSMLQARSEPQRNVTPRETSPSAPRVRKAASRKKVAAR
jgi:hypothetical protein